MRRPRFFRIAFLGISLVLGLILITFAAEIYTGKCVGISDGDTIHVLKNGQAVKIRLEGIDCPGPAIHLVARLRQNRPGQGILQGRVRPICGQSVRGRT
jgi:endonuclease YncB( thermonuclease family)